MDDANRGEAALEKRNFDEAVEHYTAALAKSPSAVPYYIKRSTAYQRSHKYSEALDDAEQAVALAFKRAKRELISQAQLRRGIAFFQMQRYGDAKYCLDLAKKYNEKEKLVDAWLSQVNGKLKALEEGDEKGKATIKEIPDVKSPEEASRADNPPKASTSGTNNPANGAAPTAATDQPPQIAQTPASKIRHDWYQSTDTVCVTLLAKGVPKDQATIDIRERSLSINFPLATGSSFDFSLEPLFAPVDPAKSNFKVLSTKIEVNLKKATAGQKWAALEDASGAAGGTDSTIDEAPTKAAVPVDTSKAAQSSQIYPSSKGAKDWDKIVKSYEKPRTTSDSNAGDGETADMDAKKDDDGDDYIDDEEEGDEVNGFFKKLYAGASDDARRAMVKSYQESGGTALSTNWDEVKKGTVPIQPPDGMEAKKWES